MANLSSLLSYDFKEYTRSQGIQAITDFTGLAGFHSL